MRNPSLERLASRYKTERLKRNVGAKKTDTIWSPIADSPQSMAYTSLADVLGYGGAAGGGKALALDTPIPTPNGYRCMGELNAGDEVFGADGCIYRVIATSAVMTDHRVFDVVFDDGEVIRADADHRWLTFTDAERESLVRRSEAFRLRRRENRQSRATGKRPDLAERNAARAREHQSEAVIGTVRTTLAILDTLRVGKSSRSNHSIPVAQPLDLPLVDLAIPPYVLGFWLGDGSSYAGRVTIGDQFAEEANALFADEGYTLTRIPSEKYGYTVRGLQPGLRALGVFKNKHIPHTYLFAGTQQRIALLQGLMDTDGYAAKDGQCEFYNSNQGLIGDVSQLLHSLGIKHSIRVKQPPRNTSHEPSYRIKFVAPFPAFRLSFKRDRQNLNLRETQKWRYIVDVREVESVPVRCIAVDSPDHLYLAGAACIPTHNTDLLLGLAKTQQTRSIIFRQNFTDLRALVDRGDEIQDGRCQFVWGDKRRWETPDGRVIEIGAISQDKDKRKYRGRPHDFIGIDEAADFSESAFRFVAAWLRTTKQGQRTRIVLTFNPPTDPEGEWVIRYFAPWLDPQHPDPAKPGELRWFVHVDGKDVEVPNGEPYIYKGKPIQPMSRTFIPARVEDNPYQSEDYYRSLDNLPEPLKSQLRDGDFTVSLEDDPWQVIPTSWVLQAQNRWKLMERPPVQMRSCGVDVARGGKDNTVIQPLYGTYFDVPVAYPGAATPDGPTVARHVAEVVTENTPTYIDVIGYGSSAYDHLKAMPNMTVVPINNASGSKGKDKSGRYQFSNLRAESYWKLREALDPTSGENIALPDDRRIRVDLCAPRYRVTGGKISVEPKEDIIKRIGFSPDFGDAVVLAWLGTIVGQVWDKAEFW